MPEPGPEGTIWCDLCGVMAFVDETLELPCCRQVVCLECEADGMCGCDLEEESQAGRRPGGTGEKSPEPPDKTGATPSATAPPRTPARGSGKDGGSPGKGPAPEPGGGAPIPWSGRCRGCDAPVVWLVTPTGGKMICDPALVPFWPGKGPDRLISASNGHTLAGSARQIDLFSPDPVYGYVPHWGTCPNADDFRGAS